MERRRERLQTELEGLKKESEEVSDALDFLDQILVLYDNKHYFEPILKELRKMPSFKAGAFVRLIGMQNINLKDVVENKQEIDMNELVELVNTIKSLPDCPHCVYKCLKQLYKGYSKEEDYWVKLAKDFENLNKRLNEV